MSGPETEAGGYAFDDGFRARVAGNLDRFERQPSTADDEHLAAVVIALVPGEDGRAAFLLTKRTSRLRNHPGQWALPGGRLDRGESVVTAGLRELEEELAVELGPDAVIGRLDDYVTRSGFAISPLVVWAGDVDEIPNPAEVASVHRIPVEDLDIEPRMLTIPESPRPVIQLPLAGTLIHAPTGAMLHQFARVAVHGESLRVDGLEQPVWAWR